MAFCMICGDKTNGNAGVCRRCMERIKKDGEEVIKAANKKEAYRITYLPYINIDAKKIRRDMVTLEHLLRGVWSRKTGKNSMLFTFAYEIKDPREIVVHTSEGLAISDEARRLAWRYGKFEPIKTEKQPGD